MFFRMVKNLDRSFVRFVTIHTFDTDRQTDTVRQTEFSSLDHVHSIMQHSKNHG